MIVVHCSDSDYPQHDDVSVVREWHINDRKFSDIGYHYFIKKDGEIQRGRSDETIGAHAKGYNRKSIGICLGGKTSFSWNQFNALKWLIRCLKNQYRLQNECIVGHCEIDKYGKTCPNFDVQKYKLEYNI